MKNYLFLTKAKENFLSIFTQKLVSDIIYLRFKYSSVNLE